MGMFDTFFNADRTVAVQTKIGPNLMYEYEVGEHLGTRRDFPEDIIIAGLEGFIVIRDSRVISVTEAFPEEASDLPCITKWGGPFDPKTEKLSDYNPIAAAFKWVRENT